jgi:hypothetical protein
VAAVDEPFDFGAAGDDPLGSAMWMSGTLTAAVIASATVVCAPSTMRRRCRYGLPLGGLAERCGCGRMFWLNRNRLPGS